MTYPIRQLGTDEFPKLLQEIPDCPKTLYMRGAFPSADVKFLTVVGSRKYTPYGKEACERLIKGLQGFPIVIVSGLALGIDSIAHRAALSVNLSTIAIPGSGLDDSVLYPRTNVALAGEILKSGGALLSEYEPKFKATLYSFPERNRIMAGISDATLVIEAGLPSGTLITTRLAGEYNRDILAVPGSIFSAQSAGCHMLIRLGATPITKSEDILDALNITHEAKKERSDLEENEKKVVELIGEGCSREKLVAHLGIPPHEANALISEMEIKGIIEEKLGIIRAV